MINVVKLTRELTQAGIPIDGCSSDGRIDFKPEATAQQRTLAAQILAAHNPDTPLPEDAEREADLRTLEDAATGLAQITAERAQITSGLTALAAATTLAQVKPIVNAMLQGMDNIEMRQAEIIKVVSRLVCRELGEE